MAIAQDSIACWLMVVWLNNSKQQKVETRGPHVTICVCISHGVSAQNTSTAEAQLQFNYHRRCGKLGIIHVCFADDISISCKSNEDSIKLLLNTFKQFSEVSGLHANMEKSSLYI